MLLISKARIEISGGIRNPAKQLSLAAMARSTKTPLPIRRRIEMDVREAIFYCENPKAVDRDFAEEDRVRAWRKIWRLINRRSELDPVAAEALRIRQDRVARVSTAAAASRVAAMDTASARLP
jgi:DNA/RNA-binding domain of Phe-tRNA-synthetase-like protein